MQAQPLEVPLPFPPPRSARPSLALRALLGLALAARRWGRATCEGRAATHLPPKNHEPDKSGRPHSTEMSTQNKGSRTRIPGFKPHKGLRFQKTCPGGSLWPHLFRRRPCGRDPKRPATKGGKGAESRDLLETRRLPPLKARGSRESSHGRRRKRGGQLDRFFENAALHGE